MRIIARDVRKVFSSRAAPDVVALRNFSLEVRSGEFMCILGPSGCGKSTFLTLVSGIQKYSGGSIDFEGERASTGPLSTMVFQGYALFPWRTVIDNIAFGRELAGQKRAARRERAQQFIDLVHLNGFEQHYPHQLSGGMRQRVAIARALCTDPEIFLMDEPLAALDAQTRSLLQIELLRIWTRYRKTIIYVTHSIEEAVLLGDRVAVMTARPGTIKAVEQIDLPRPRTLELLRSPEFNAIAHRLWKILKEEVEQALNRSLE